MRILNVDNIKILNEIGRWKVISLQHLLEVLGYKKTYSNLRKKIKALEKYELVKTTFDEGRKKYLMLTEKGAKLCSYPALYTRSSDEMLHDLIASCTVQALLNFDLFKSGSVSEFVDSSLDPDGIVHAVRHGREYILAIEVELTQKSQRRIVDKFIQYFEEDEIDHVLYITNKKSIFNAYQKILKSMKEEVQEKIILGVDESLSHACNYKNITCWMDGKVSKFEELFGEKR